MINKESICEICKVSIPPENIDRVCATCMKIIYEEIALFGERLS